MRTEGIGGVSWSGQGRILVPSDLTTYKGKRSRRKRIMNSTFSWDRPWVKLLAQVFHEMVILAGICNLLTVPEISCLLYTKDTVGSLTYTD